jgi:hypothetical protein
VALAYHDALQFVQLMLPTMRLTRQRNLAWSMLGILRVRDGHLTVSEMARAIESKSKHWHNFKRLWRFVCSEKWSPAAYFHSILCFVLARFRVGHYLPVIIDQSTLAGKWEILWASIPFRGRALPIYFEMFRQQGIRESDELSQNLLEDQFVQRLATLLPRELNPVLLFDRGYARVPLMQLLDTLAVHWVIRVRKGTWVRHKRYAGPLAGVPIRRGGQMWCSKARYHKDAQYVANLAVALNATAEEPWFLLTNLHRATTTVCWYERRFRCEELFRDVKDQLHLETIRVRHMERARRILFCLVIAYLALTLIGVACQQAGFAPKVCKDKTSAAWMALRLLTMSWILKPQLIKRALFSYTWSLTYESG